MHRGGNIGRGWGDSLEGLLVGYSFSSEGEASCISQICRVIKLIKRLTHLTPLLLFRFTLSSQSALSLSISVCVRARCLSRDSQLFPPSPLREICIYVGAR